MTELVFNEPVFDGVIKMSTQLGTMCLITDEKKRVVKTQYQEVKHCGKSMKCIYF